MEGGTGTLVDAPAQSTRLLRSGDESGSAPGDRPFRPDVEGLRAVAVLLVVLYHANVPLLSGGYIGVDVFFVISGFVITGLLLRERQSTDRTSFVHFYARRSRRILPAACLVILLSVVAAFAFVGSGEGILTADDGRWAAAFLANFHFQSLGTDYLASVRPPSPLLNYWSLSVEEQFYLVYPALFALVASLRGWLTLRLRMAIVLAAVIVGSFAYSVFETASNPSSAYFSPFTRAWELALGALIAALTAEFRRLPTRAAVWLSWTGLAAIVVSACVFGSQTPYPGSLVAIPVVGAALVIGGGVVAARTGAESILGSPSFRWLGRRSYSLYLVHWPILIIAAYGLKRQTLSVWANLALIGVSLVVATLLFRLVENPIRHWRLASARTVAIGLSLIVATILILTLAIRGGGRGPYDPPVTPASSSSAVASQVDLATNIRQLPHSLEPPLSIGSPDWGGNFAPDKCEASFSQSSVAICSLGDVNSKNVMVVYGDSHAQMWIPAFEWIASNAHWKLIVLSKTYCPAEPIDIANPGTKAGPNTSCSHWHKWVANVVRKLDPDLLVMTQASDLYAPPATTGGVRNAISVPEWRAGLVSMFHSLQSSHTKEILLGSTPKMAKPGQACVDAHQQDLQACSLALQAAIPAMNQVEQSTAAAEGVDYIDPIPWFCSSTCPAVIGHFSVYLDTTHINATFARYLEQVLGQSLGLDTGTLTARTH
jgi:peptidoglycan/LPS O-acetylase OafA/YrhL